jgi:hypothetical protein
MLRPTIAGVLAVGVLAMAPAAGAQSSAPPPQAGVQAGQMGVSGTSWSFSGNVPNLGGPWGFVTVTNTNCTSPYRPGTAQAGAVIFTASLTPELPASANLQAFTGSSGSGQVKLLPMADTGGTNVAVNLSGLDPSVSGTTLTVCLTQSPPPPMLADIDVGEQQVAATNFDVSGVATADTDAGQPLIAISGTQTTADANRQLVFFFLGSSYLGTDTENPSLAPLQLVGSPGPDQIDVSYTDPAGGPNVTITYTLSNGALAPSGTPPGH